MSSTRLTKIIFITYLIFLMWVILFKMDLVETLYRLQYRSSRSINLIPFAGTAVYDGRLDYLEIVLNICIFLPYGIYLPALHTGKSRLRDFLQIILSSFLFELLQFLLSIGVADVTDLLANSLGGLLGILLFTHLEKMDKNKVITRINRWSLLGSLLLLLYMKIRS